MHLEPVTPGKRSPLHVPVQELVQPHTWYGRVTSTRSQTMPTAPRAEGGRRPWPLASQFATAFGASFLSAPLRDACPRRAAATWHGSTRKQSSSDAWCSKQQQTFSRAVTCALMLLSAMQTCCAAHHNRCVLRHIPPAQLHPRGSSRCSSRHLPHPDLAFFLS